MYHAQTKIALKRVEIMVAMQKGMSSVQAESCDQAIDSFPHRVTLAAKGTVVLHRRQRQFCATSVEDMKFGQVAPHLGKGQVRPHSLHNFAQDKVRQSQTLPIQFLVQPGGLRIGGTSQIFDPVIVSIHAPVRGATKADHSLNGLYWRFNPRPRAGGDPPLRPRTWP